MAGEGTTFAGASEGDSNIPYYWVPDSALVSERRYDYSSPSYLDLDANPVGPEDVETNPVSDHWPFTYTETITLFQFALNIHHPHTPAQLLTLALYLNASNYENMLTDLERANVPITLAGFEANPDPVLKNLMKQFGDIPYQRLFKYQDDPVPGVYEDILYLKYRELGNRDAESTIKVVQAEQRTEKVLRMIQKALQSAEGDFEQELKTLRTAAGDLEISWESLELVEVGLKAAEAGFKTAEQALPSDDPVLTNVRPALQKARDAYMEADRIKRTASERWLDQCFNGDIMEFMREEKPRMRESVWWDQLIAHVETGRQKALPDEVSSQRGRVASSYGYRESNPAPKSAQEDDDSASVHTMRMIPTYEDWKSSIKLVRRLTEEINTDNFRNILASSTQVDHLYYAETGRNEDVSRDMRETYECTIFTICFLLIPWARTDFATMLKDMVDLGDSDECQDRARRCVRNFVIDHYQKLEPAIWEDVQTLASEWGLEWRRMIRAAETKKARDEREEVLKANSRKPQMMRS